VQSSGYASGRRAASPIHLESGGLKEFPDKTVSGLIVTGQSCFAACLATSGTEPPQHTGSELGRDPLR
jgi:hypothetical protein